MAKFQRRHYETIAAGLKEKNASDAEVQEWIRKFQADNPRFRSDFFIAAVRGTSYRVEGPRTRSGSRNLLTRTYRNKSRDLTDREIRRLNKLKGFGRYRTKSGRCKFGKKRVHGRFVCRKSPRRK